VPLTNLVHELFVANYSSINFGKKGFSFSGKVLIRCDDVVALIAKRNGPFASANARNDMMVLDCVRAFALKTLVLKFPFVWYTKFNSVSKHDFCCVFSCSSKLFVKPTKREKRLVFPAEVYAPSSCGIHDVLNVNSCEAFLCLAPEKVHDFDPLVPSDVAVVVVL